MLTAKDIKGVCVMMPTPCKEGHEGWDSTDSVDLDETARLENIRVAGHQINFLPGQNNIYPAYKMARTKITAGWSTSAAMGPEPVALPCLRNCASTTLL